MNHPILPGMIDTYVRQHQHELEQKARLNEQLREAAEANRSDRASLMAAPLRGFARLVTGVAGLAGRLSRGSGAQPELEAKA
jgi:hypothetical protein